MLREFSLSDQAHRYTVAHAVATLRILASELIDRDCTRAMVLDDVADSLRALLHPEPEHTPSDRDLAEMAEHFQAFQPSEKDELDWAEIAPWRL